MKATAETNWPPIEERLLAKSNEVAIHRHGRPGEIEIPKELQALGFTAPTRPDAPSALQEGGPEGELLALQVRDVARGLKARSENILANTQLDGLLYRVAHDPQVGDGARNQFITEIGAARDKSKSALNEVMMANPESFLAITSQELRRYQRQLERGRIAETPYVEEKKQEVLTLLSRGQVVFLHGETGTGKTELALIAGRAASEGREPILVRGYKGMTSDELFGHMTLTSSDLKSPAERVAAIQKQLEEFKSISPNMTESEERGFLAQALLKSGTTITEYIIGTVYRAAAEGRTLIIDEANYIPPELMAKMNAILTKRPGEKIDVQEDGIGPITVKDGFGIILTGNINPDPKDPRYQGRTRFDLALEDRIRKIEYNYLPQATEGALTDYAKEDKQLFTVVLASLLSPYRPDPAVSKEVRILESIENRHGSLYLPGGEEGLKDIWRLCKLAAVTQQAFAGKVKDGSAYGFQQGGVTVGYRPDVALSPRVLMSLLQDWKGDGFQMPLEQYLKTALLDRATKTADKEYLYQLAKKFDFFQGGNWPSDVAGLNTAPKGLKGAPVDFVPGRAVISAIYGEIPKRTVWPEGGRSEQDEEREKAAELIKLAARFSKLQEESAQTLKAFSFLAPTEDEKPATS